MAEARQRGEAGERRSRLSELELMRNRMEHVMNEGSTLSAVRIEGLSDQLRNDLRGRIPVHSRRNPDQGIDRTDQLQPIRQFDEHLEIRVRPSGEGQSELVIVAPAGGDFEFHVTEPERVRK